MDSASTRTRHRVLVVAVTLVAVGAAVVPAGALGASPATDPGGGASGPVTVDTSAPNATAGPLSTVTDRDVRPTAAAEPSPVTGTTAPTDPDGDGRYEDLSGDGRFTILDVALFLDEFDRDADDPRFYDFTGDGSVGIGDVGAMLELLVENTRPAVRRRAVDVQVGTDRALIFDGQVVVGEGFVAREEVVLRRVVDSGTRFVEEFTASRQGETTIDTLDTDLQPGEYRLRGDSGRNLTFEVAVQTLNASFNRTSIPRNDPVAALSLRSNRAGPFAVNVTEARLDDDELLGLFGADVHVRDVDVDGDGRVSDDDGVRLFGVTRRTRLPLNFSAIDAGDYRFGFDVLDTTASAGDATGPSTSTSTRTSAETSATIARIE